MMAVNSSFCVVLCILKNNDVDSNKFSIHCEAVIKVFFIFAEFMGKEILKVDYIIFFF